MSYNIADVVWQFIGENKTMVAGYFLLSLGFPISQVLLPYYYGALLEDLPKTSIDKIWSSNKNTFYIIIGLWILSQVMYGVMDKMDTIFVPKLQAYLRKNLVVAIIESFKGHYSDPNIGELISQIVKLPAIIKELFHQIRSYILPSVYILLSALGYFFYINTSLGLLALLGLMLFGGTLYVFSKKCFDQSQKAHHQFSELHEHISDLISNLMHMYSFDTIDAELEKLNKAQEKHRYEYKKMMDYSSRFKMLFNGIFMLLFMSICGYSFYLYSKKKITIAQVTSVVIIMLFVIAQMDMLSSEIHNFVADIGVIRDVQNELNNMNPSHSSPELKTDVEHFTPLDGSIRVKNFKVKYPNFELDIPELVINNGEKILLKGEVGSGKSTFMYALMKLQPFEGEVSIGGQDISKIDPQEVRNKIMYIPQQPRLFNRSVYKNIVYGTDKTREDVVDLLNKHQIKQIRETDLDRKAGKNGTRLSGGQRQMVYILRYLLREPKPIVILDEPTSAMDNSTRDDIMKILDEVCKDKTVLLITHDETLHSKMDRVINFEK